MNVKCSKCNSKKPETEFPKLNGKRKGFVCLECWRIYHKEHYKKNKQRYIEKSVKFSKIYIKRNREFIKDLKNNTKCKDCGNSYQHYVMTFDHLRDKKEDVGNMVSHGISLEKLKNEIDKCDIICANCHAERTWKRSHADEAH